MLGGGGFLNKARVKTIGEGEEKNEIHPSHKGQENDEACQKAATIYVVHVLLPCIPLFTIFDTFYPFRSNLHPGLSVAFMALFCQKRLETASLSFIQFRDGFGTFLDYGILSSHKKWLASDPVTCWMETLSQLKRATMQMQLAVVQRPVPGDPAVSASGPSQCCGHD